MLLLKLEPFSYAMIFLEVPLPFLASLFRLFFIRHKLSADAEFKSHR